MAPDNEQNVTFAHSVPDVVTKPDGRYLIYYSWPGLEGEEAAAVDSDEARHGSRHEPRGPDQRPWSPEGGPADE
jgi:hypothetical protein